MLDEDRLLRMKRDSENAPAYFCKVEIMVNYDGTMSMNGPFGDKEMFLQILDQATQCVRENSKERGWLITTDGDAKARPEGYS
jgi:hypothetical protein